MRKFFVSVIIVLLSLTFLPAPVAASLVVVESDGSLKLSVLSAQDASLLTPSRKSLEIEKVASSGSANGSIIKLNQDKEEVSLEVYGDSGRGSFNVTDYKESVVEIRARPNIQKIAISVESDGFRIDNDGVSAFTSFPIMVDSNTAQLDLETTKGYVTLSVLPFDAVQFALRTRLMTKIDDGGVSIVSSNDVLEYKISGAKVISLFNIYDYSIPISSYISASTGEVLKIDAPGWLKFINLIFS